jgi:hypothetical protein
MIKISLKLDNIEEDMESMNTFVRVLSDAVADRVIDFDFTFETVTVCGADNERH